MLEVALDELVARLRDRRGDTLDVEVKTAAGADGRGALPEGVRYSLCALANLPGGGMVLLGLDERRGFHPVGLSDAQQLMQGLAQQARTCTPPVVLDLEVHAFEGSQVILARVTECDPAAKPCRVQGHGWVRGYDGDYRMSDLEEQAFLRLRQPPLHDRQPVSGTSTADLDPELTRIWITTARSLDAHGLGRFTDEQMLVRGGVVHSDGELSVAGLLTLGVHPQQFFPRFVITLAADSPGVRARELVSLSGPIPRLLEGALDWARKALPRTTVEEPSGHLRDSLEYPLEAFRELVGNALVHRDLDAWSAHKAVEVRLTPDSLVVTNPGGLYGITVDRLGLPGTSSPRNGQLIQVCQYARTADDARVVETLASGIPRVIQSLREAHMPPPTFYDTGLQFTVRLIAGAADPTPGLPPSIARRNPTQRAVYTALLDGPLQVQEVSEHAGIRPETVRKALRTLVKDGLLDQHGGRGRTTTYSVRT